MSEEPAVTDYPSRTTDKIRYADTDRQGHVNNAVFATLFETGRAEMLYDPASPLAEPGTGFVIVRLAIDFLREINWPGIVAIGTRVASIGRSSVTLEQGLFQAEQCVATAETVIVLMDAATRRSCPLPPAAVKRLSAFLSTEPP
ncbi:MAG: acyl-CoA thioesterase [Beijerinckiaceae bacterium]